MYWGEVRSSSSSTSAAAADGAEGGGRVCDGGVGEGRGREVVEEVYG